MKRIVLLALLLALSGSENMSTKCFESTKCFPSVEIFLLYSTYPDIDNYISKWVEYEEYPTQIDSSDFLMILEEKGYLEHSIQNTEK